MSETRTAVRIEVPVTFRKGTERGRIRRATYPAGTIFENWIPAEEGLIEISPTPNGEHWATIHIDNATPVEWDETEQDWIEE